MNCHAAVALVCIFVPSIALAQRDPPLLECYLPSITIVHAEGSRLELDLVLKKETGPVEHKEHQMYLLGYLVDDEVEVFKIASDVTLLDKRKGDKAKLFLDVLLEKGLVTKIDTKVVNREGFAGQDVSGRYADGSKAGRGKADFLRLNTFSYRFSFAYSDLFQKLSLLKRYQPEHIPPGQIGILKSRFKLLVFVPVNDCKYATDVRKEIQGAHDVGLHDDRRDVDGGKLAWVTPILYFRPLPYELQFRKDEDVGICVYLR